MMRPKQYGDNNNYPKKKTPSFADDAIIVKVAKLLLKLLGCKKFISRTYSKVY